MAGVVIFDGVCNLCSGSVRFILEHEASPRLRFAAIQSAVGSRLMREHGMDPTEARTFVLIEDGVSYTKSEAAIRVCRYLRQPWRAAGVIRLFPPSFRDWLY